MFFNGHEKQSYHACLLIKVPVFLVTRLLRPWKLVKKEKYMLKI